jgi:hypothetical protein
MDSREQQTIHMENVKRTLSTLWIFVTLNYLYCDVVVSIHGARRDTPMRGGG